MSLPEFKTKDEVPEPFRAEYIERDGKWVFDDKEAVGLKESQKKLLNEKKAAEKETQRLKELHGDLDEDAIAELIKGRRSKEEEDAKKSGDFEKLFAKREKELRAELEPKVLEGEKAKQALEARDLETIIRDSAGKAKVIGADMKAVIKLTMGDRVKKEGDKYVVYDADGDPTTLSVDKFFAETFKTEYPKFYEASGAGGGGAGAGGGKARADGTIARGDNAAFLANVDKIAKGELKVAGT